MYAIRSYYAVNQVINCGNVAMVGVSVAGGLMGSGSTVSSVTGGSTVPNTVSGVTGGGITSILSRITSYNVCYTKLLRLVQNSSISGFLKFIFQFSSLRLNWEI